MLGKAVNSRVLTPDASRHPPLHAVALGIAAYRGGEHTMIQADNTKSCYVMMSVRSSISR